MMGKAEIAKLDEIMSKIEKLEARIVESWSDSGKQESFDFDLLDKVPVVVDISDEQKSALRGRMLAAIDSVRKGMGWSKEESEEYTETYVLNVISEVFGRETVWSGSKGERLPEGITHAELNYILDESKLAKFHPKNGNGARS